MVEDLRRSAPVAATLVVVLALGLASRRVDALPSFVIDHAGDLLWATALVLAVALVRPAWAIWRVAVTAAVIAVTVELSQLWEPGWLEDLRGNEVAALVLGRGFLWGDLVRYGFGVLLGSAILVNRYANGDTV